MVEPVDDRRLRGLGPAELLARRPAGDRRPVLFAVDGTTVTGTGHPVPVIGPDRVFRAVPGAVRAVENNLTPANMDFAEFADAVDADGVFRGWS